VPEPVAGRWRPALNLGGVRDDDGVMSRREAVRVVLFARGALLGQGRAVRCAIVNLSAAGAMLTLMGEPPAAPLRLQFELGGDQFELPVVVCRAAGDGSLAVTFPQPHSERLHHLIAAEQRRALAQGRANISERRLPPAFRGTRPRRPPRSDDSA
jgi:PilZ domain